MGKIILALLPVLSHALCGLQGAVLALWLVGWLAWPWWLALAPALIVGGLVAAWGALALLIVWTGWRGVQ
jgi:ABC-type xylose transport system permease subunit